MLRIRQIHIAKALITSALTEIMRRFGSAGSVAQTITVRLAGPRIDTAWRKANLVARGLTFINIATGGGFFADSRFAGIFTP